MPKPAFNGRRPARPNYRFADAILNGPSRSLEHWAAATEEHWMVAADMLDENRNWDVQHVIEHVVGPAPVQALEIKSPRIAPAVDPRPTAPKRTLDPPELPLPLPKRPRVVPVQPQPEPAHEPPVSVEAVVPPAAVEAVEPAPLPEAVVAGPLPGTYVLTSFPLWQARHNLAPVAWDKRVTELVQAYGPFPDRFVIIVSIRYSRGSDMGKEQYGLCVKRAVEAASTLIRHIRARPGQDNRQFLIYPWIRTDISSASNWFDKPFSLGYFSHGVRRTTTPSCRLKELEFVLDNVRPTTEVWWLSIGIDALTTDIENLRRAQVQWPGLHFTLAVMVHASFMPSITQFGPEDICPPRPAVSGLRIRIYSFARLLRGAENLGYGPAKKLLDVWQYINDAKLGGRRYDKKLTFGRNTMPVSPEGLAAIAQQGLRDDRI